MIFFNGGDAAKSATHDDSRAFGKLGRSLQPAVIQGEVSCGKSELQKEVHLSELFLGDEILRMKFLHFAGDAGRKVARVKTANGNDSGFALKEAIPVFFDPHSQGRNQSDSCNHRPPPLIQLHEILPVGRWLLAVGC